MSESPSSEDELDAARDTDSAYRKSLRRLNKLVKNGGSLSGHERNCAFLNLHGKSFATINAVSGIDFADDGRGMAITDWDGDGDLDVWLTNRTSPRVRYLRNELNSSNSLAIRLQGTTCNRDAIGARVTVTVRSGKPLIKTLRAGEGYLSQSSKTLHFGLGQDEVESVSVRWPGGTVETHDLPQGSAFLLKQNGEPVLIERRNEVAVTSTEPANFPRSPEDTRMPMSKRIPLPRLPVIFDEPSTPIDALELHANRPILITLWTSWCEQCRDELAELTRRSAELHAANIAVVAVNVDGEFDNDSTAEERRQVMESIGWTDTANAMVARSTKECVRRLRVIHDLPFGRQLTMPVPISFLVDRTGKLAVVYRGRTSVGQVLSDGNRLSLDPQDWYLSSFPLPGRWNERPPAIEILPVPRDLLNSGHVDDAYVYVQDNEVELQQDDDFGTLRAWLADELIKSNRALEGRAQYEAALKASPNDITLMNNLAWLLATHPDDSVRSGALAVTWATRAARVTHGNNPAVLDTLAACYAEAGDFDKANRTVRKALQIATANRQSQLVEKLKMRASLYATSKPFRQ